MPVTPPPKNRPLLRRYAAQPWTLAARTSPALRKWCSDRGYLTPNFSVAEMADTLTHDLPLELRDNARRHCFNLERYRHRLHVLAGHEVAVAIDGPSRTRSHNVAIHGAVDSRHVHGDATDHFINQVERWADEIRLRGESAAHARDRVVAEAEKIFPGVGNENSGTLHFDSRPGQWVRFVNWVGAR